MILKVEINITLLDLLYHMENNLFPEDINNPFNSDKQGQATHLSTWDMKEKNNTFIWRKKSYVIESYYEYETNLIAIKLYYNNKQITEMNKPLYSQQPTVENITRETQQEITKYLNSW